MLAGIRKRLARNFCTISYFFRRSTLSFLGSYFFFDASLARISAAVIGNCKLPALIEPVPLALTDDDDDDVVVVLMLLEALLVSFGEPFAGILLVAAIVAEGGGGMFVMYFYNNFRLYLISTNTHEIAYAC
uniref:Uncharacterized protein n=1 Tax=Glossina brevipalpis TaxID=37001 RepID=A0A1A9WQM2_9MUSC